MIPQDAARKIDAKTNNHVYSCLFEPNLVEQFQAKPNAIPPMGLRIRSSLEDLSFQPDLVAKFEFPETAPWLYWPMDINLTLSQTKKEDTNPSYFLNKYREIEELHGEAER